MGAYANPETYIDTQSGKAYQNMFESIANTASDYATRRRKDIDEKKKTLEANQLEIDKGNLALYGQLDKNTAANKSIDWHTTYDPYVQEYADLNSSLLNGTSKDRASTLKRMSSLKNAISTSADTMTSLISGYEEFNTGIKKIGLPGGVSSIGNDVNKVNAYNVLTGKAKGSVKVVIEPETLIQSFVVSGDVNGKPFTPVTFDAVQLNKASNGEGVINYNYDTTEQDDLMKIESGLFTSQKDKAGKDTGVPDIIKDEFYLPNSVETTVGVTQKAGYISSKDVLKLDESKAIDTLKPKINIQADGLLADPLAAAGTYHDVFKGADSNLTAESLLADPKKKEEFKKAYLDYVVRTLPKERPILDENGNVTITTIVDPKAPKKGRATTSTVSGGKPIKPYFSEAQIDDYKKKYAKLVDGKITELVVPSKGGQKKFIFNKEKGAVQEVSADMLEVRNNKVSGPYFRETILGIPAKTKPKLK